MLGISLIEALTIIIVAVLVLRPSDWPKVLRSVGKALKWGRNISSELSAAMDMDEKQAAPPPPAAQQRIITGDDGTQFVAYDVPDARQPNTDKDETGG